MKYLILILTSLMLQTQVIDESAKSRLLGAKKLSLQWISWNYFGKVEVSEENGTIRLKGRQDSRKGGDYLTIEGVVTEIKATEFKFRGKIVTSISHINGGQPCLREGDFTFKVTGKRRYWRLQEMQNPCEDVVDYIDIYF
ncbi:MAG: hypothetical protein RMM17_08920 [Acidobacteriota bacterium]|nr:hypothetical protein [Blastocatellia bacterium]MDW8412788.1 hypothetical protein [Acidobacteriota bacterium]